MTAVYPRLAAYGHQRSEQFQRGSRIADSEQVALNGTIHASAGACHGGTRNFVGGQGDIAAIHQSAKAIPEYTAVRVRNSPFPVAAASMECGDCSRPASALVERHTGKTVAKIGDGWHNLLAYRYSMKVTHHRATRHSFSADIAITNVKSEKQIIGRTTDLSLFGCFVKTTTPFPRGTTVRLRINRGAAQVAALGTIAYSLANEGMGIVFGKIEPSDLAIIEKWLAQLRNN